MRVALVVTAVVLFGCKAGGKPAHELAEAVCRQRSQCACASDMSEGDCVTIAEQLFSMYTWVPMDAGLEYEPECGAKVIAAYEAVGCGDRVDPTYDLSRGRVIECGRCKLYPGTGKRGDECMIFEDTAHDSCGMGLYCHVSDPDHYTSGTCVDPCEPAALGEDCRARVCAAGLVCPTASGDHFCQVPVGVGEACSAGPCAEGLVCSSGTCQPIPQPGEPCLLDCATGSYCGRDDAGELVCKPLKPTGDGCASRFECESLQCDPETLVCTDVEPLVCSQLF